MNCSPSEWEGFLPFPPTLNTYYRHVGPKVLISRRGRDYRRLVGLLLLGCPRFAAPVSLELAVRPPDNRRRDLDNLLKGLQDALVHAGLLADDSLIRRLSVRMDAPVAGGFVRVRVAALDSADASSSDSTDPTPGASPHEPRNSPRSRLPLGQVKYIGNFGDCQPISASTRKSATPGNPHEPQRGNGAATRARARDANRHPTNGEV